MKNVSLTVFDDESVPSVLESFGIKTELNKATLKTNLKDEHGQNITCDCCGTEIHLNNIGNILRGSKKFYCKNPACYANYLISKKL